MKNTNDILTEKLSGNQSDFDSKHKLNISEKSVSISDIQEIDSGISSEKLLGMNLPICFYRTQITIHGKFSDDFFNRICGYKSIIKNKNLSIGVKYRVIDSDKKHKISKYLEYTKWNTISNSQEYFFIMYSKYTLDKSELQKMVEDFKLTQSKINISLFSGSVNLHVCRDFYGRGWYLELVMSIGTIKENNVDLLIENLTGKTVTTLDIEFSQKAAADKIESEKRDIEREKEYQEMEAKNLNVKNEILSTHKTIVNPENGIYYKLTVYDGKPEFIKVEFQKKGNTVMFRKTFAERTIEEAQKHPLYGGFKKCNRKPEGTYTYLVV